MKKQISQPWLLIVGLIAFGILGGIAADIVFRHDSYEDLRKIPNGDSNVMRIFYACAGEVKLESGSLRLRLEKQLGTNVSSLSGLPVMDAVVEILSKEPFSSMDRDRAYKQFTNCVRTRVDELVSSRAPI